MKELMGYYNKTPENKVIKMCNDIETNYLVN